MTIRDYKYWAEARLDEDGVRVVLRGSAVYTDNGRSVTVELQDVDLDATAVGAALDAALQEHHDKLEQAITVAAAEALSVAARLGELK
jgi:hypothetical protein